MAKFKNISPLGALDVPLLGRVVEAGEVIEVDDELVVHLKGQDETWKPMSARAKVGVPGAADSGQGDGAGDGEGEGS